MLVEVKDLTKRFGKLTAANGVHFSIPAGEAFGLLGPNGAGKTTTVSMMCGLVVPSGGDVVIDGHSILRDPMAVRRVIGVVPQDVALYPTLSARENLTFFARMQDVPANILASRVDAVLDIVQLADRQKDRVETYSGGMKRRINIAVGLLNQPKLLILDEPTVGVDPQSRNSILETLKELNRQGMTLLYTSHYMEEVEFFAPTSPSSTMAGSLQTARRKTCDFRPATRTLSVCSSSGKLTTPSATALRRCREWILSNSATR